MTYPTRLWIQSGRYINKTTGRMCKYDDIDAIPLWTSKELTRQDHMIRREEIDRLQAKRILKQISGH